jgi:hypothetical protein
MTQRLCPTCKGAGKCPSCEGRGTFQGTKNPPGVQPASSAPLPCASCFGTGKCRDCGGEISQGPLVVDVQ